VSLLYCLRDIARYWLITANFAYRILVFGAALIHLLLEKIFRRRVSNEMSLNGMRETGFNNGRLRAVRTP